VDAIRPRDGIERTFRFCKQTHPFSHLRPQQRSPKSAAIASCEPDQNCTEPRAFSAVRTALPLPNSRVRVRMRYPGRHPRGTGKVFFNNARPERPRQPRGPRCPSCDPKAPPDSRNGAPTRESCAGSPRPLAPGRRSYTSKRNLIRSRFGARFKPLPRFRPRSPCRRHYQWLPGASHLLDQADVPPSSTTPLFAPGHSSVRKSTAVSSTHSKTVDAEFVREVFQFGLPFPGRKRLL